MSFFSVETIAFSALGYSMSWIELVGTVLYLLSVWLIAQRRMATWPIGIVSSILFAVLFYQIRLYADAIEQVYFIGASAYGWWYWATSEPERRAVVAVSRSAVRELLAWLLVAVCASAALGATTARVHLWAPAWFPERASYPYLDASTTVMSFVAMWLMARKRLESWMYWIVVDVIGVGLYVAKGVRLIAVLYVVLLVLSVRGFLLWLRISRALPRREGCQSSAT